MNSPDPQQEYANALHRIAELEQELAIGVNVIRDYEERITELEEALKNIANGDTPWLDGYSETPGECYQKYAAYVLGKEIEK